MDEFEKLRKLQKDLDAVTGGHQLKQLRRDMEAIDSYARFAGVRSALQASSRANDIIQSLNEHDDRFRRLLEYSQLDHVTRYAEETIERINAQFFVPQHDELERMLEHMGLNNHRDDEWWRRNEQMLEVMRSIQQPWLFVDNPTRSIQSVQRLSDLGQVLRDPHGYGLDASAALRWHIGDWRDQGLWKSYVLDDIDQRTEVYSDVGFDEQLIDLPELAFRETSTRVEVRTTLPALAGLYGASSESDTGSEFVENTKEAYAYLNAFERALRDLIEHEMTKHFGSAWLKLRLPDGMYEDWCRKRDAAHDVGLPSDRLIDFADFTDYKKIIMRKANWREVFKACFQHEEAVHEAFNRLHPVRLAVMHNRKIRRDDELLLYVETKRLFKIIPVGVFHSREH